VQKRGSEACRVPVVAVTERRRSRDDCREAGMDDFLTKPVDQLQFAAVLARVMRATAP
jgi:CheY-like chemotaxis protein